MKLPPWAGIGPIVLTVVSATALPQRLAPGATTAPADDRPYQNPDLTVEARAADLVSRMTLDEKVSQLVHDAAAIPRLDVPAYNWWNECLHGVARAGVATVFPQAIGLAASFDTELMGEVATAIGDEARAKHHEFLRHGQRGIYQGLTFWSPNVNIFRDPRWGRGQETYGEDPYLTSRMGVAFVKGLQGDDPRYYKVIATAKHFAVHSGPEPDRHHFDARVSDRDLYDTYLPAFRALVQEGRAASVMGAYNRIGGEPATASRRLLGDILRGEWGFDGYVVSDCGAVEDIYRSHNLVKTPEEAAALAVRRGCDLECGFGSDAAYLELPRSVARGLISEKEIDVAVTRLMSARLKLGMFDPPERVRYAQTPYSVNASPEHDRLARRMAQESIVLLKNAGILPLRKDLGTIAVVGPNADAVAPLLGNYNGTPAASVTVLAGIRAAVSRGTRVVHAHGVSLVEGRVDPNDTEAIPSKYLRPGPDALEQGLKGEYFKTRDLEGPPAVTRVDPTVDFRWMRGAPTDDAVARGELSREAALPNDGFSVRWTGQLLPPTSGTYVLAVAGDDGYRLVVDGRVVVEDWQAGRGTLAKKASLDLEGGRAYDLRLEYFEDTRDAEIHLGWTLPGAKDPFVAAVEAARDADAVVFVGGLSPQVEGEEMRVTYPGFRGGDRTDLALPAPQEKLLEAVHATGKPVVLVLMTGSAIAVNWAEENVPAILAAWYPGQRGGTAVADVLFGDVSPSGRLPVTFYRSTDDLPPFEDYDMRGRTYRYFGGKALYPFGHGLSYTRFEYSGMQVSRRSLSPKEPLDVSVDVKNTGGRDGDEVVELYVREVGTATPAPLKDLRGFRRIHLKRGEEQRVAFRMNPETDFARYDVATKREAVEPGEFEIQVGSSSQDVRAKERVRVE
jgi:beta-glucosidase